MATNHGHAGGEDRGEDRNPSVDYDKSDLSARGILIFFLVLAIFGVVINLGVLGMYIGMTKVAEKHEVEVSPLAPQSVTPRSGIMTNTANVNVQRFPEPRLQTDEAVDMTRLLVSESAALTAQPYQDAQGNAHVPIDEAMKQVATRLPVRAGSTAELPNYPGAGSQYSKLPVTEAPQPDYEMNLNSQAPQRDK